MLFACCTAFGLTLAEHLLMTTLLIPLTKLDLGAFRTDLSAAETQSAALQDAALQMQEQAAAERITAALNAALAERQVSCRILDVSLHIQPDGSISITEVTAEGNLLTGTVLLKEWLGTDISVTEGGSDFVSD